MKRGTITTAYEVELVRFLADQYPKEDIISLMDYPQWKTKAENESLRRLDRLGYVDYISRYHVRIYPAILELVHEWDNPPLRNYKEEINKRFWSHPLSKVAFILIVGFPAIFNFIETLKNLFEWFYIKVP